jgi:hypothetical protein
MMRNAARIAVAAALCFGAAHAMAEPGSGTTDQQDACRPDVFRLCSGEIPNRRKIVACLRENRKQLSPACRKVFS